MSLNMILICASSSSAQELAVSARGFALGDADISEPYDVSGMFYDPATLAFLQHGTVSVNHLVQRDGFMNENLATIVTPPGNPTIALGVDFLNRSLITRSAPYPLTEQYGYDLAVATSLTTTFSVGGTLGIRYGRMSGSQAWATSYAVGAVYYPSSDVSYSILFDHLGTAIQYGNTDSTFGATTLDQAGNVEVGAEMRYPSSNSLRKRIVVLALATQKYFDKKPIYYKFGLEVYPVDFIALRMGYLVGTDLSEARYGVGFLVGRLRIDYGIAPAKRAEIFQQFSASLLF